MVPDGAHLAGSVFGDTSPAVNDPGWSALLTVDDDPFAVFDDVSAQLRDLGVPMPGTGASCLWQGRDDVGNDFAPLQAVAAGDPGGAITALDCAAIANHGPDAAPGRPTGASMALRWDEETTGRCG